MQTARTTIELDRDLLRKIKQRVIEEDKSLKQFINETLKEKIEQKKVEKKRQKVKKYPFKVYNMGKIKGTLRREEIYDWL